MAQAHQALSEKEKETLRLLLAGHDAKSMARHLGLSVHTVNERLRDSRRKLSVSSSREAARLLHEAENPAPQSLGDKDLGDAAGADGIARSIPSTAAPPVHHPAVWTFGVIAMISLALALLALPASSPVAVPAAAGSPTQSETAATQSALRWLALVDAFNWRDSWAATAQSFRAANTVELWESASQTARVPLGKAVSRTLIGADFVPTPPNGNWVAKFRTRFAGKPEAVETLALVREDGDWKVVGYFID